MRLGRLRKKVIPLKRYVIQMNWIPVKKLVKNMNPINLYPDQKEIINHARGALRHHKSVLIQSSTGSGKTVMASSMAQNALQKSKNVFFICHRQELIHQTSLTFEHYGLSHGVIWAQATPQYHLPLQICSIDTLKNRLDQVVRPDLIIWDECHHIAANGWAKTKQHFQNAYHIGLSATPTRLDGKGLKDHFDYLVPGKQTAQLMELGRLSGFKFYAPTMPDTSGLKKTAGDYNKAASEFLMDTDKIHGDIVRHWLKYARGKCTIVFAVTIEHSKHIAEAFRAAGIMAAHLDADTKKEERRAVARAVASGDIQVITNVGLMGEGYDLAAQAGMPVTIDCVIDAQPTQSLSWCLQKWGRALRTKLDGSKAIILDHAGNWTRHGFPDDDRDWSLEGNREDGRKKSDEKAVSLRQCPKCFAVHHPAPACSECGFIYPVNHKKIKYDDKGELKEMDVNAARQAALETKMQQGKAQSVEDLVNLGYSEARANHIVKARVEKDQLRLELLNLLEGAKRVNLHTQQFSKKEVMSMKPKQLRETIQEISNQIA